MFFLLMQITAKTRLRKLPESFAALLFATLLAGCGNFLNPLGAPDPAPTLSKSSPAAQPDKKFAWGFSTASYQYEDPAVLRGRPQFFSTDWDLLVARRKAPPKGNALYSWSDFDKDLEALKTIRPTHYRFSIEWARVEPQPGIYNQEAIEGYAAMARKLKHLGIEPVVCLWHFTFPDWLYDQANPARSNWLHPLARSHWKAFVEKMVAATAPYTNYYAPQNEPNGQITTAYIVGQWPPNLSLAFSRYWEAIDSSTAMFRDAAAIIKKKKPSAQVLSIEALPWWRKGLLDPGGLIYNTMQHGNTDHLDRIYDVCDLLGINYYYSQSTGPLALLAENYRRGPNFTMMGWRIDPKGLYQQIATVGKRYGKPMMITENGIATRDDRKRISYMQAHLAAIGQAIRDGHDVRGYFSWSLADNYEWHYGYKATFGLATMDPQTKTRKLKPSAHWYAKLIRDYPTVKSIPKISPAD